MGPDLPLSILHVGKYFPPETGGMEHYLHDLAQAQQQQGMRVQVLVHARSRTGSREEAARIPLWRVPTWGERLYTPISPAFPLWLQRAIGTFRPHLLHLHLPNPSAFWALLLPAARRIPAVLHWHADVLNPGGDPRLHRVYRVYRPFEQALLRHSAAVLTTSPSYQDASPALAPWRDKCHVLPLALGPERLHPACAADLAWARQQWPPGHFRVLATGRLSPYKGFHLLPPALGHSPSSAVVLVGKGPEDARIRRESARHGTLQRLNLTGPLDQGRLSALFEHCEAFVLPSTERAEAFGLVLLEAMARSKPLVVADIPGSGVGWVAAPAALRVPPNDAAALGAALEQLHHHPEQRRTLGAAGAQTLQQRFHLSDHVAHLESLYRQIHPQRPGPE